MKKSFSFQRETKRQGDPVVLVGDCKKAKKILGWTLNYTLEDTISHTIKVLYGH